MKYYLAVDIGASSGRHILSHIENGKIVLEEVYRFYNGMDDSNGHKVWNTERLFSEILAGMKKCKEIGKIPATMGIDTWGVDFALLDKDDKLIGDCVAYRDDRTNGMDEEVYKIISEKELYECLDRANAAASIITTRKGALSVMPTIEEIMEVIGG